MRGDSRFRLVLRRAFALRRGNARPRPRRQPALPVHRLGACRAWLIPAHRPLVERRSAAEAAKKAFITTRIGDVGLLIGIILLFRATAHSTSAKSSRWRKQAQSVRARSPHPRCCCSWARWAVRAVPLPCVAPRRNGGSHARQRAHTRRHDGSRRSLSRSAHAPHVRAGAHRDARRGRNRADNLPVRRHARTSDDRHQARPRIFHDKPPRADDALAWPFGLAAAIFHLVAHGVSKAMLFLGAGSVMHGTHEETDMRKMGGLRRTMPLTAITFRYRRGVPRGHRPHQRLLQQGRDTGSRDGPSQCSVPRPHSCGRRAQRPSTWAHGLAHILRQSPQPRLRARPRIPRAHDRRPCCC